MTKATQSQFDKLKGLVGEDNWITTEEGEPISTVNDLIKAQTKLQKRGLSTDPKKKFYRTKEGDPLTPGEIKACENRVGNLLAKAKTLEIAILQERERLVIWRKG